MSPREKVLNPEPVAEVIKKTEAIESEKQKKSESEEEPERASQVLVSHTDAYVHDRMKGQPKTLDEVDIKVMEPHQGNRHRLSLPRELEQYTKKYAFRWLMKTKRAIDEACDVKGWVLVNRTHFPDLPKHYYTVNGSIERGDTILAFMPQARANELRQVPGQLSNDRIKQQFDRHKDNPNFYVPKDEETEQVIGI